MPDERPGYAYPPTTPDDADPLVQELLNASKTAYEAARARGLSEKKARIEAARAAAGARRVLAGEPADDPSDAEYERAMAERKARAKRPKVLEVLRIGVNVVRRREDL